MLFCSPVIFRKSHQSTTLNSNRLQNGIENTGLGVNYPPWALLGLTRMYTPPDCISIILTSLVVAKNCYRLIGPISTTLKFIWTRPLSEWAWNIFIANSYTLLCGKLEKVPTLLSASPSASNCNKAAGLQGDVSRETYDVRVIQYDTIYNTVILI